MFKYIFLPIYHIYNIYNIVFLHMLYLFIEGCYTSPEMEIKEFEPRVKSAKTRFKFSAGLILETFDTILSGTNHI